MIIRNGIIGEFRPCGTTDSFAYGSLVRKGNSRSVSAASRGRVDSSAGEDLKRIQPNSSHRNSSDTRSNFPSVWDSLLLFALRRAENRPVIVES